MLLMHFYRQEFVKAVDAWRSAGSKPSTGAASVGTAPSSNSTSQLVKQLAQQMDSEQQELSRRLQLQKEQATQKLRQVSGKSLLKHFYSK